MVSVIFIAPPAAGKGTISKYLVGNFGYTQLSTGDLLRKAAKEDTTFGRNIKQLIDEGFFVSDEIVLKLIERELEKIKGKAFILDGIPRNILQAKHLEKIFEKINVDKYIVINLDILEDTLKKRATGRRLCNDCHLSYNIYFDGFKPKEENVCDTCHNPLLRREDDAEEVFISRYQTYLKNTLPLIHFYQEKGLLYVVDANCTNAEILENVEKIIKGEEND